MNRLISNLILGFFVIVLIVAYGVFKQPSTFSLSLPVNEGTTKPTATNATDTKITLPNGEIINVIVATSLEDRKQGLSGVDLLADDVGMLFVFPNLGQHNIWMQEMNFPLDIVWLDETGKVVYVVEDAPPPDDVSGELPVYQSELPAKYVLEMTAGKAESAGIEVGDTIVLS